MELSEPEPVIQVESSTTEVREIAAAEQISDGELIRLTHTGSEDAFLALYRRHQGPVFRFAMHMSGRREIGEEVTQDVFVALLSGRLRYREADGTLQAFLIGAARNQVRRRFFHERCLSVKVQGEGEAIGAELVEALSREQELDALRLAILTLPPRYREVVVLCDLEEMNYVEAASQLGCALGTVKSRLNRARAILTAKLRKREGCPA